MKKLLALAAIILIFSGCLGLSVFYGKLHVYVINKLDNNFNLNRPQRAFVKSSIISYQQWQKKSELVLYRRYLVDVRNAVASGITREKIDEFTSRALYLYERTVLYMLPDIVRFMRQIDETQVDYYLQARSKLDSRKFLFMEYPDDQYCEMSHNSQVKQFEKYLGPFNEFQINAVKRIYDYDKTLARQLLIDDINARSRFADSMRNMKYSDGFYDWVKSLCMYGEVLYTEEEQKRREIYYEKQRLRLVQVYDILTDEQKKNLINKIDSYIEEIDGILDD